MSDQREEFASQVAEHYNQVEQKPLRERNKSDIIDLRKFNNAMKSWLHHLAFKFVMVIYLKRDPLRILDLGCGKGGDLRKFLRYNTVGYVVGVDIADVSIQQCKERYEDIKKSNPRCYKGEFFVADLTRVDITPKLAELEERGKFHVASTQFSIHYSFESFEQAVRYISNAEKNLVRHGIFIGTYPDGPKLLKLARQSKTPGTYEVDDILKVTFAPEDLKNPKPFGTKYHFHLKEVVDCPEFLVHPEVLRKLMSHLGFYEVFDRSFEETLREALNNAVDRESVKRIFQDQDALDIDHEVAKARLDERMWRAASVYRCFCYKKIRD